MLGEAGFPVASSRRRPRPLLLPIPLGYPEHDDDDEATGNPTSPSMSPISTDSVQLSELWGFEARRDLRRRIAAMDPFKLINVLHVLYPGEPIRGGQMYGVDLADVGDSV